MQKCVCHSDDTPFQQDQRSHSDISETPFQLIRAPLSKKNNFSYFVLCLISQLFASNSPSVLQTESETPFRYIRDPIPIYLRPHSDISETPSDWPFLIYQSSPFRQIRNPFQKNIFTYFFLHNFLHLFASNSPARVQVNLTNLNIILTRC